MASLKSQFLQLGFHKSVPKTHVSFPVAPRFSAVCGLRGKPRKTLWRSRGLSKEAVQAVQALKLATSDEKLRHVFRNKLNRLLKDDLFDTLAELQRQNELELALKVFNFVIEEAGYDQELSLYSGMILLLGRNKLIDMVEKLFSKLKKEGIEPETSIYTEMIGAYLQVGRIEKAMETYNLMKASGCKPDKLTFMILIRNLEKAGEKELAETMKEECAQYMDSPEQFLQEVEMKQGKRRTVKRV